MDLSRPAQQSPTEVRWLIAGCQFLLLFLVPLRIIFSIYGAGIWSAIYMIKIALIMSLCRIPATKLSLKISIVLLFSFCSFFIARFRPNHEWTFFFIEYIIVLILIPISFKFPIPKNQNLYFGTMCAFFFFSIVFGIPESFIPWITGFTP